MKPEPPKFKVCDRLGRALVYAQNVTVNGHPALFMSGNAKAGTFTVMNTAEKKAQTFKAEAFGLTFQAEE